MTAQRTEHNKLVRDKVPKIMHGSGISCVVRPVFGEEKIKALQDKLVEENQEYLAEANKEIVSRENLAFELVDIIEVAISLAKEHGITEEEIMEKLHGKRGFKGSFDEGTYLMYSEIR